MEVEKPLNPEIVPGKFQTRRLLLRPLCDDDAPGMYSIYSDPRTMKYWSSSEIRELEEAARMVSEDLQLQQDGSAAFWSIVLPGTGRVIGKFTLFHIDRQNRRAEIGYVLHRQFWRKGYGTEVLHTMLAKSFDEFRLHRLEADIDPDNVASISLLKKAGFREEGRMRERWNLNGEWRHSILMGLLEPEWRLARAL